MFSQLHLPWILVWSSTPSKFSINNLPKKEKKSCLWTILEKWKTFVEIWQSHFESICWTCLKKEVAEKIRIELFFFKRNIWIFDEVKIWGKKCCFHLWCLFHHRIRLAFQSEFISVEVQLTFCKILVFQGYVTQCSVQILENLCQFSFVLWVKTKHSFGKRSFLLFLKYETLHECLLC